MLEKAVVSTPIMMISGATARCVAGSPSLTNRFGETMTAVTAIPRDDICIESVGLLTGTIPSDGDAEITIQPADKQGVFYVMAGFTSAETSNMPHVDVCQTDDVIIE